MYPRGGVTYFPAMKPFFLVGVTFGVLVLLGEKEVLDSFGRDVKFGHWFAITIPSPKILSLLLVLLFCALEEEEDDDVEELLLERFEFEREDTGISTVVP